MQKFVYIDARKGLSEDVGIESSGEERRIGLREMLGEKVRINSFGQESGIEPNTKSRRWSKN